MRYGPKERRVVVLTLAMSALFLLFVPPAATAAAPLTAPRMNNPSLDVTATNARPLLSVYNAAGGREPRTYEFELSSEPSFPAGRTMRYEKVPETTPYLTEMRLPAKDALQDGRWFFRVRARDAQGGTGPWAATRFFLDTVGTRHFCGLLRRPVQTIMASSGEYAGNIVDWNDPGQATYWLSAPPGPGGKGQWIVFDMGVPVTVSRFWMLSNPDGPSGRLISFSWQYMDFQGRWTDIPGASIEKNDTFRNILDIPETEARFFRLHIRDFVGLQAQLNSIIPYGPGLPSVPIPPKSDYVLIIGDQMNGFTYTKLSDFVKSLGTGLETLSVSHREASPAMIASLSPKPVAIIVSGNNADYPNMPMFEYYGVFEIIRTTDIPLLGICAGHQFTSMAYGLTFARGMGWFDDSTTRMELCQSQGPGPDAKIRGINEKTGAEPIKIRKGYEDLPIFQGMPDPFVAVEIHSWAVSPLALPEGHEIIAESSYVQAVRARDRLLFGAQFHGEAVVPYNQGGRYIKNFLDIAQSAEKARAR
ncbi:MAG: discoidin domain-containing protein [Thermodesulfobacteriota bacterium]